MIVGVSLSVIMRISVAFCFQNSVNVPENVGLMDKACFYRQYEC